MESVMGVDLQNGSRTARQSWGRPALQEEGRACRGPEMGKNKTYWGTSRARLLWA